MTSVDIFKWFDKREVQGKMLTDDEFGERYMSIYSTNFQHFFSYIFKWKDKLKTLFEHSVHPNPRVYTHYLLPSQMLPALDVGCSSPPQAASDTPQRFSQEYTFTN